MKSNLKILICIGICAVLLSATVVNVIGKAGGYYDAAQTGCGNCHGDTPTASLVITVTGVPATYVPLTVYPLTLTVSGGPASPSGGFNLEISAGTLSTTDGNVEINAALDQAVQLTDIGRTWDVDWTAPGVGTGNVNLWAVLMTGNDDGKKDAGDLWKLWSALVPEEGGPGDVEPPVISNVLINGAASQTYDISAIPALTLTATVDDSGTGNSDIGGANYTEGVQNWPTSAPMSLQSPPTSPTEDFDATIPAPGSAGTYYYYPYGWDDVPNYNSDSPEFATLIITESVNNPPDAPINPVPADTATGVGLNPTLSVDVTDPDGDTMDVHFYDAAGPTLIGTDFGVPSGGTASVTWNGLADSTTYNWYAVADDGALTTQSATWSFTTIMVDTTPPEISNVLLNGAATQTYPLSAIPPLILTATLDDSTTGGSDIGGANYTEGALNWPTSAPMALQNPPTSQTEDFDATIPAPGVPGTYTYYVYGWDEQPNNNVTNVLEFVTLTITDDVAPLVSNVLINGAASQTYDIASIPPLILTATVDDSATGGSDIGGANYTEGAQNWPSSAPMALQSPPTSPTEDFEATIPAPGATGTYYYYPYGWDDVPNYNTDSPEYATLIITGGNNPPDAPFNPVPADLATGVGLNPALSVDVTDPDGDTMDVHFYDTAGPTLIGTDFGVPSGGTASVTWNGLADSTTYNWYAVADDGEFTTQSLTWSFTTIDLTPPAAPTGLTVEHYGVSSTTTDALPSVIDGGDTAGTTVAQINADDGTTNNIGKNLEMWIDAFDITGASDPVTAATLWMEFSVEPGHVATNAVEFSLNEGAGWISTGIVPVDGDIDRIESFDIFASGVDTIAEIAALDVHYLNDDAGGADPVYFDYVWVTYTYGGAGGTDDNAVNWTASADDGAGDNDVDYYNIYRSDVETGPWDVAHIIDTEPATGAASYSYIDLLKGQIDATRWWYVVRAVDLASNEEMNTVAVQEPGTPAPPTYDIPIPDPAGPWPEWRLLSFPIDISGDVVTLLDDLAWGDGGISWDYVQWYDASDAADHWKSYNSYSPPSINDLPAVNNTMGLWVHITENTGDAFLTVGSGVDDASTDMVLYAGWNLIGYPANDDSTYAVLDLKAATGAIFVEGYDGAAPYRLVALADAYIMTRGEAYWVFIPADIIWIVNW